MVICRFVLLFWFLHVPLLVAQDADFLTEIKELAFTRSQAAEDVFYLADVFGPRFMDSPGDVKAGDWAVERLKSYGLANVAEEYFVTPGMGWGINSDLLEVSRPSRSAI